MTSTWQRTSAQINTDDFESDGRYDVVVVGAGLTGLTTAVLLSRARLQVAVIEAQTVGAGTTGHSTAKLSLLQGGTLQQIRRRQSIPALRAYVEANREGQSWLLRYLEENSVQVEHQDAYTFALRRASLPRLRAEAAASGEAGVMVEELPGGQVPLPFEVAGALRLPEQAQLDPMRVLGLLAEELRSRGGKIFEHTRMLKAGQGAPIRVQTPTGNLYADQLVLATGTPVLDRGGHFARLEPNRSYALAYRVRDGARAPEGMFLAIDSAGYSIRTARDMTGPLLLVGGHGHRVGRGDPAAAERELDRWARDQLPVTERTDSWSAQDYRAAGALPIVGTMPGSGGQIHVATGFNKWGMTNAVAAALRLSSDILGGNLPWARQLSSGNRSPGAWLDAASMNATVARLLLTDWARMLAAPTNPQQTRDRPGVHRQGRQVVAENPQDPDACRLSGVCTHLGGILQWNAAQNTWDCPLHGSRFSAQGRRLEGPATRDLKRL